MCYLYVNTFYITKIIGMAKYFIILYNLIIKIINLLWNYINSILDVLFKYIISIKNFFETHRFYIIHFYLISASKILIKLML